MPYGLKYQTQFDSRSDPVSGEPEKRFTLQFLFKDYSGGAISIEGADVTVIQKCTVDDPVAAIKGQSLGIRLLNKSNTLPILSFFSEDDDGVMVKLLDDSNTVRFIGFLVQDDFSEEMIDWTHPIMLSANDSLGLLKGVILKDAASRRAFTNVRFAGFSPQPYVIYIYSANAAFYLGAGSTFELLGVSYTVSAAVYGDQTVGGIVYNWQVTVTPGQSGITPATGTVYLTGELNLLNRNSILSLISVCLAQTNLELLTNIFHNLFEVHHDPALSAFEQTLLDSQLFISGETYEDCYSVLGKIMTAFKCSLFQANGQWNIVHWPELRRHSNNIPGFIYDEDWALIGTTALNNSIFLGPDPQLSRPVYPFMQYPYRGWKFSRKQFNYNYPKYLLYNYDLLILGALRTQYTVGNSTFYEYEAPGWEDWESTTRVDRFIRVEKDTVSGSELGRFLVLKGNPTNEISKSVRSWPIEVNQGDKIKVSFSVRGTASFSGTWTLVYYIRLTNSTDYRYVDELPVGNGDWGTSGFIYNGSGNNTINWNSVEIQSSPAPYSGILYVFLTELYTNGAETLYKDIRFEQTVYINDTTKIIGHIHKQEQDVNKKLNNDLEINIDDTPRNAIVGTLFLPTKNATSGLQDRTSYWDFVPYQVSKPLGHWNVEDELRWRQQTRLKHEGSIIGMYQGNYLSLLSTVKTDFNPTKTFVFGLLTIDYKNNTVTGDLWEMYDSNDTTEDVGDYSFTYIYSSE